VCLKKFGEKIVLCKKGDEITGLDGSFLLASCRSMTKIEGSGSESGSGSIRQRHGSADPDPDPPQNVMDPQHCTATHSLSLEFKSKDLFFWGNFTLLLIYF
jgi:hypothetical protein